MRFAAEGQREAYLGIEDVAGVPCEHYRSVTDSASGHHTELDYYFSAPGWRVPETHASRVPVLLNLTGHYPRGPGVVHHYHHYYSFNHFRVGPDAVPDHLFVVPLSAGQCSGNVTEATVPYAASASPACDDDGADTGSTGLDAGTVIGLCLLC